MPGLEYDIDIERINDDRWLAKIRSAQPPAPPEPYVMPLYCQREDPWASMPLGFSDVSIADFGCLLCDMAMGVSSLLQRDVDPLELNELLMAHPGGYVNEQFQYNRGNLLRFAAIWEMFPEIVGAGYRDFPYGTPATPVIMHPVFDDGGFCAGKVDFDPVTRKVDQHWVIVTGHLGDQVYSIVDPWDGKRHNLPPAYGRGGWAARTIFFRFSMYKRSEAEG